MARRSAERGEHMKALVRAEGNFEEHPYFRVGDRNAGSGVLRYENELKTGEGHKLKQTWTVLAAHGRGLPGRFDQDVYVALLHLIDEKGMPEDGWLWFSLYELVELMGRGHSGRDYRQVSESLRRMATTSVESVNAFYHRGRKEYLTATFSLLAEVKLSEHEGPDGARTDRNRVLLSRYFVDSYKADYLKDIDPRLYWSLQSPVAKRLYRLIDKKRNGRRTWEAELFSLRDRIPLSAYRYASKIKEKLAPAHSELIQKGFLAEVTYRKAANGEFAAYKIDESFQERRAALPRRRAATGEEYFCIQRLKAEGMDSETAERLVYDHGPARVMHYVEALPHQKNVRNPAGWLRSAIESAYELDLPPTQPALPDAPEPPNSSTGDGSGSGPLPPTRRVRVAEPDPRAQALWERVLAELSERPDTSTIGTWLSDVDALSIDDATLTLAVPNAFAKEYVQTRFGELILAALRDKLGQAAELRLVADPAPAKSIPGGPD